MREKASGRWKRSTPRFMGLLWNCWIKWQRSWGEENRISGRICRFLKTGMSQAKVALIPPGVDQVLVGDMERTRLKDIRALFFVGMNEGNIPKNTESGGLLTELDRDFFEDQGVELAPGPKELMNMQRFYLYLNLTRPSEHLYLSYSCSNAKGEAVSPAYLIGTVRKLFPELLAEKADEPENLLDLLERSPVLDFYCLVWRMKKCSRIPYFRNCTAGI